MNTAIRVLSELVVFGTGMETLAGVHNLVAEFGTLKRRMQMIFLHVKVTMASVTFTCNP